MSYNLLQPFKLVSAASMGASVTSPPVEVKLQDNVGFQMNWTGSPVGTFSFQVSMDYLADTNGNVVNAGNWITLPVTPAITAAGVPDVAYVDLNQISATYARVVYTRTSGTGSLTIYADAKGI